MLSLTSLLSELVDQRALGVAEDYLFVDSWVPPIPVTFGGQEWPEAARLLYFHFLPLCAAALRSDWRRPSSSGLRKKWRHADTWSDACTDLEGYTNYEIII